MAERTAAAAAVAAGKLTRTGSLPPLPSQYDGTRVNECTYTTCACTGVAPESVRIDCGGVVAASRLR